MPSKPDGLRRVSVRRVIDGDTVLVHSSDSGEMKIRLIGIDSPESHESEKLRRDSQRSGKDRRTIQSLGARASAFTTRHLGGQDIHIELGAAASDRYGRTLAYVWLGNDLYNVVILREGYAGLMTVPPNVKYADVLAACYRIAREDRRGLWAQE